MSLATSSPLFSELVGPGNLAQGNIVCEQKKTNRQKLGLSQVWVNRTRVHKGGGGWWKRSSLGKQRSLSSPSQWEGELRGSGKWLPKGSWVGTRVQHWGLPPKAFPSPSSPLPRTSTGQLFLRTPFVCLTRTPEVQHQLSGGLLHGNGNRLCWELGKRASQF